MSIQTFKCLYEELVHLVGNDSDLLLYCLHFRSWQNTLVFHGVKQDPNGMFESSECAESKVRIMSGYTGV